MDVVTLWLSYVGRGAPSNAAGEREGLGWTKAQASEQAGHWNNQAPWEKFRRVDLCDRPGVAHFARPRGEAEMGAVAFSWLEMGADTSAGRPDVLALYASGLYASAWLALWPVEVSRG